MNEDLSNIKEFVAVFIENYTQEIIEDDVVGFYNDVFVMLQHFNDIKADNVEIKATYVQFINHIIQYEFILKEYSSFDFGSIKTLESLHSNTDFKKLAPIYTNYSFTETEEAVEQILEELKTMKEFGKELREEIDYLLDEYTFHLNHIKENIQFNFYTYTELEGITDFELDEKLEEFHKEKSKFIQKCNDKLAKK
ncbi:hypothetical protein H1R17_10335 [Flavobacterium sp. xlx-214]|uniref:hypothetical protein n=1 Tax=unclassified Flavobacterium TaxID=196869 RepID=UPI0013CF61B3|nr:MULTISPECIES: hypothetical protein [unclassified Flavobacterium]MBA5791612.1 hypothetical protein [Flavobacterium sp. xlx-221]QMI82858.1 hypothetical protein H1R17_10335 [Flavobacterium sp. xlx-214]